jgi:predicted HTH transcriptional regulator
VNIFRLSDRGFDSDPFPDDRDLPERHPSYKPIPYYQVFKRTVFELVDQAVDFVLSKINRSIGTREHSVQASAKYELPMEALTEAIVNAVAHRDYVSNAGVQVMLFAERLEVWNPGELPPSLTPELLQVPHASIPRNPLLAEPLYLVRYIEKAGTGTLNMIARCRETGLPEPDFEPRAGQWVATLWRDWLTDEIMAGLAINDRKKTVIALVKTMGRITSGEYRAHTGVEPRTATRDLNELVKKRYSAVMTGSVEPAKSFEKKRTFIGHIGHSLGTQLING